jgi:hypothetical protein
MMAITNTHTAEELLEVTFSVWFVPKLFNEDQHLSLPFRMKVVCKQIDRLGCCCKE